MTRFHAITCTADGTCDPPRDITFEVRGRTRTVTLAGCPHWRPERTPASALGYDHTRLGVGDVWRLAAERSAAGLPAELGPEEAQRLF